MDALSQERITRVAWGQRSALTAYAYAWLKDWSRADDVVQDAFVVMLQKWQDCESLEKVGPWLRGIVRFKIMEARRAMRRQLSIEDETLDSLAASCVEERLDELGDDLQGAQVRALQDCMKQLSDKKRRMVDGYYLEQRSYGELGRERGISANAIAQALCRIHKALRDCTRQRLREEGVA